MAGSLPFPALHQGRAVLARRAWSAVIGEHTQLWVTFGGVLDAAAFFLLETGVPGAQCVPFGALSGVLASWGSGLSLIWARLPSNVGLRMRTPVY